jgi:hypothetical protein
MMKLDALIKALQALGYILELRSAGFFNGDQYAARFAEWKDPTCSECDGPLTNGYLAYEHADTLEEVILEAAIEIISLDRLNINVWDYE